MRLKICIFLISGFSFFLQGLKPNELGKIPIITYHAFGKKNSEFVRSVDSFYHDLKLLRENDFYPIRLRDFLEKKFHVPKGKIPVLITFDDSAISQFRYLPNGEIDPECAVGVMEKFKKDYPDYPLRAVFFVMPGARYPNNLFGQPMYNHKKVKFLLENGYEIASHTYWHANLSIYYNRMEEVLAKNQEAMEQYAPNLSLKALALPFGKYPPEKYYHQLFKGSFKGKKYQHELIFDYSNKLSDSPYSVEFKPVQVHRLHGFQGVFDKLFRQRQKEPQIFFVSDGDPDSITLPEGQLKFLRKDLNLKIITY